MQNKIYIGEIILENYANFTGEHKFDLRDKNGFIHQWTVILGNNNTGKTNILKAIANLEPKFDKNDEGYSAFFYNGEPIKNGHISIELFNAEKKELEQIFEIKNEVCSIKEPVDYIHENKELENSKIYGYGVSRRSGIGGLEKTKDDFNSVTLFDSNKTLINIEEWLLQLDYAKYKNDAFAIKSLEKLKEIIKTELLPEIEDFEFSSKRGNNYVRFKTKDGLFKLNQLAFGYQSMLSWIFDLAKKMFERYPDSENPLKEPAVVLVDEIDLHLHPEWQRNIIKFLSDIFVQTQFIVTTHSPFVVQSFDKINLFVLNKTENGIDVRRPDFKTYKGWTIEEILKDIMNLEDKTKTDLYKSLLNDFDNALDTDDYEKGLNAYNKLLEILNPETSIRKILEIKFSQLVKND